MSKFNLFRTKMAHSNNCELKYESSFIVEGTSATEIYAVRLDEIKQAALIITDKEGPDATLVYTYRKDTKEEELLKGDYFTWKDNTYFVFEDVDLVHDAVYKKQRAYQCNVEVEVDGQLCGGYFVSSLAKYVDTSLQKDLVIDGNEKPILIAPYADWAKNGTVLKCGGKTWRIIDFDLITNNGIAYLSLDREFNSVVEDVVEDKTVAADELVAGVENTVATNLGYFAADVAVQIVTKQIDAVTFIIPYGIDTIAITTKAYDGVLTTTNYKVVLA